jgi:hypothetical protein
MSDGSFLRAAKPVKVTIGGCGWYHPLAKHKTSVIRKIR